ncbi:MAG: carbon starvation protein A [Verrucomicrobiota bacterium]|nr:carbon starvation protein A [Verrucomicrobiota bacterium]
MNSLFIIVVSAILYIIAYNTYGRFLSKKIFKIDSSKVCPSVIKNDNIDYLPTSSMVLFGHHFTSIAGTGPIVGPAIAIIWGWVPALIWILVGSIFMGAVHDFGSLMISLRNEGRSIGDIAGDILGKRVKILFLIIIFLALLIVISIFGVVISQVFTIFPTSVIPVWIQIPIAIWLGYQVYKKNKSPLIFGLIAVILMYLSIVLGINYPIEFNSKYLSSDALWVIILLAYAFISSILPVSVLLQPRDYINAFQLIIAIVLLLFGILLSKPAMVAPALNLNPLDAPPIFPILFITLACGAISGFHCLVSSGTTSKQCASEDNALSIGYGSMLLEGFLAIIVIIACGAGIGLGIEKNGEVLEGFNAFNHHYYSWNSVNGLGEKISAFINGSSNLISSIGISNNYVIALMGLFVAAFAATTLDTSTRLQRYILTEISSNYKFHVFKNKYISTSFAVGTALLLAFSSGGGKGAFALWPLFGSINQLLGALALLVITIWLAKKKIPIAYTLIPLLFMFFITFWAISYNIEKSFYESNYLLLLIGAIILILQLWILIEGLIVLYKTNLERKY